MGKKREHFETRAIHAGQSPDPTTGAVTVPIYQTSTYVQSGPGEHKGYEYSRTDNPTRRAFEECIADLEEGRFGIAFGSGMAAISTCLNLLKSGDHVICSDDVYGGTFRIFDKVYRHYGLEFSYVDSSDIGAVESALTDRTRLLWIETPTNPMLKISDIAALADLARKHGLIFCVDNTFMSPYFQKPLLLGADIVVHSTTKYLGGHSDIVGGCIVTSNPEIHDRLRFCQNAVGAVPGPFDCFLALRGLKTLAVRMERHEQNGRKIVEYLQSKKQVKRLYYPGLKTHPGHAVHCRQATGYGAIISFDLGDDLKAAVAFLKTLRLFSLAESLGGVESLAEHPAIMTHASVDPGTRRKLGITDGFIRLSVGIEHSDDLIDDLENGFAAIG